MLTEPHCGTDLGLLKTRAEPAGDGTYRISGTKIFITGGEHDPHRQHHPPRAGAPAGCARGTKNISLFIVPKLKVARDGSVWRAQFAQLRLARTQDGHQGLGHLRDELRRRRGYLIGQPNRGLNAMFTMMNTARIAVGYQAWAWPSAPTRTPGLCARPPADARADRAEVPGKARRPAPGAPGHLSHVAHAESLIEGGRVLGYHAAQQVDILESAALTPRRASAPTSCSASSRPSSRACSRKWRRSAATTPCRSSAATGIAEWGMEQFARDARITTIYEGTTPDPGARPAGAQDPAATGRRSEALRGRSAPSARRSRPTPSSSSSPPLAELTQEWIGPTQEIGKKSMGNPDEMGAAAVDYLFYAGYIALAYFWARSVAAADARRPTVRDFKQASASRRASTIRVCCRARAATSPPCAPAPRA